MEASAQGSCDSDVDSGSVNVAAMVCNVFEGCKIEICDSGDALMSFNLTNGRQWKKRVWPRLEYPRRLLRWNSNEEILSYFISFDRHQEWLTEEVPQRSPSGTILFFDKTKTKKYRNDGYDWKTRTTTSKTIREDRMKLKVGGYQLLYGCYAHSASDSNFHRRTYWLLQNPSIVMVHYLDSDDYLTVPEIKDKEVSVAVLDPTLTPTDWSLLTISDCNLCALLNMTADADTAKMLLIQLSSTLCSNFRPGDSLLDVITKNNNGLPVNMYDNCRSKKMKSAMASKKDGPCDCECPYHSGNHNAVGQNTARIDAVSSGVSSTSQLSAPLVGGAGIFTPATPSPSVVPTLSAPLMPSTTQPSPVALRKDALESLDALKVLSKSPHLIMSYHKEGSVSYILTFPTSNGGPVALPGPRLLPRPPSSNGIAGSSSLRPLQPAPLSSQASDTALSHLVSMGKKKNNKVKKVQPKDKETTPFHILSGLQKAISGLVRPSNMSANRAGNKGGKGVNRKSSPPATSGENVVMTEIPSTPVDTPVPPPSVPTPNQDIMPPVVDMETHPSSFSEAGAGGFPCACRDSRSSTLSEFSDSVASYESAASLTHAEGQSGGTLDSVGDNLDPKLFEVPLSWFSLPDKHTQVAQNNMEDVLNDPSTAASLYNHQRELTSSDGTFSGDRNQQAVNADPLSLYNWNPTSLDLDINDSTLDEMLKAQSLAGDVSTTDFQFPNLTESGGAVLEHNPEKSSSSATNSYTTTVTLSLSTCNSQSVNVTTSNIATHSAHVTTTYTPPPSQQPSHHYQHHHHQRHLSSPVKANPTVYPDGSELSEELHSLIFSPGPTASNLLSNPTHLGTSPAQLSTSPAQLSTSPAHLNTSPAHLGTSPAHLGTTNQQDSMHHSMTLSASPISQYFGQSVIAGDPHTSSVSHTHSPFTSFQNSPSTNVVPYDLPPQQQAVRKTSNISIFSEPPPSKDHLELEGFPLPGYGTSTFHLSLPNLATGEVSPLPTPQQFHTSLNVQSAADTLSLLGNIPGNSASPVANRFPGSPSIPVSVSPSSLHGHSASPVAAGFLGSPSVPVSVNPSQLQDITCLPGSSSILIAQSSVSPSPLQDTAGCLPVNSSAMSTRSSISPSPLQDIPEGIQITLENALGDNCLDFFKYRTATSVPSSPSGTSATSSSMSMHEAFDESPSVRELCEMLSESPNVQQADFSNMILTDMEQDQLFHAAEIIQHAFRKYKNRRQLRNKEKSAALLIENYYKKYREAKQKRDMAARRIQNQYRIYKHRTREVDRAATFIQQVYRSKAMRSAHPYQRPLDPTGESSTANK